VPFLYAVIIIKAKRYAAITAEADIETATIKRVENDLSATNGISFC
jgi:uncharacterized protein YerC